MDGLWVWTVMCLLMDVLDYLVSCFRKKDRQEDSEDKERKTTPNHDQSYFK